MHRKSLPYKDTWAAPGSQLYLALENNNMGLAKAIYEQCEAEARDLVTRYEPSQKEGIHVRLAPANAEVPASTASLPLP
jgi:hypothetical protein